VTVHLKLSDESRLLLDESRLRRIGPQGVLVNTARGAIVDEAALARVLSEGALGGAALDVFVEEPLPAASCESSRPTWTVATSTLAIRRPCSISAVPSRDAIESAS
jgi:phosphoglycerate dehydrogenase-like enzyme